MNPVRRLAGAASVLLFVCAFPLSARQTHFPGDEALAITRVEWNRATQQLAVHRLSAVLRHLKIDRGRAARFGEKDQIKFIKTEKPLAIGELSDAVLLARKPVKIVKAKNLAIIANADVDISFATGVIVIASGRVRIGHEMSAQSAGIYVTHDFLEISHARNPVVYAIGGAEVGAPAFTAYNTPFDRSPVERSIFLTDRLFRSEPERKPSPTILALGQYSLRFKGSRCTAGMKIELLEQDLQARLRGQVPCGQLDSASVRCESDGGMTGGGVSLERWTLRGCGRELVFESRTNPYTRSVVLKNGGGRGYDGSRPPEPLTGRTLRPDEQGTIARLFAEALAHQMKGEIVPSCAKYAEVLKIAPDYRPALSNLANCNQRIARADAAAASFTALIDAGNRNAQIYADRGVAYLRAGDLGRGLADFDTAAGIAPADPAMLMARAEAYFRAGRPVDSMRLAGEIIARFPRPGRAYEVRAWSYFVGNRPEAALADARSSLAQEEHWTQESFAREKAGYRVIVGYFALRQTASQEAARDWLRQWRAHMTAATWPDAFAQYLLGELGYGDMRRIPAALQQQDQGNALGEATMFTAIETHLQSGSDAVSRSKMTQFFREGYAAGPSLALVLYNSLVVPSPQIKRRAGS